ncbi:hypothetical protein SEA_MUFASA8_76 [Arthrobacter phage Mufasa8]|uniref:Uncharacterized protein n=1 Tax=Arthrobacter phage Mufasa8 TaxID=2656526 RepID=A0A649VMW4_9CAUD|nr:hypothetical protein HYQ08_gp076 [Arthrobacter phage Mufasa8]QGJ93524.1 hypothetical protein SEA_MUFASA8_76 [Arthrobacter phage Mufasa8]
MRSSVETLSAVAANQVTGLTLAEIYQFVQEADAAGIDPREPVVIKVGFRSQLKCLSVCNSPARVVKP